MQLFTNFVIPFYKDLKEFILDTLFPISCLACEQEGKDFLCKDCAGKLPKVHQICIICHKPSIGGLTHPNCKTSLVPNGLISFLDYHDERVSKLIIHGKYYFISNIYKILGRMLADFLTTSYPHLLTAKTPGSSADESAHYGAGYNLTPIPLHWTRKNWRGFNQAEILCQELSTTLNLPVANILQRSKITKTQKDLKKEARKVNIKNAFSVLPQLVNNKNCLLDQSFILVDDVATTGSTLCEGAKILKQCGAKEVICLTVARD